MIAERPAFTLGYAIHQGDTFTFSHGAWFSTVCRDQLPFVSQSALRRLTADAPAYREAFADSPLHAICRAWRVGRASAAHTAVISSVPTLVFVGRFDPYGPEAQARRAVSKLRRCWLVQDPTPLPREPSLQARPRCVGGETVLASAAATKEAAMKRTKHVALPLAGLAVLVGVTAASAAAPARSGWKILHSSSREGDIELYILNADGTARGV